MILTAAKLAELRMRDVRPGHAPPAEQPFVAQRRAIHAACAEADCYVRHQTACAQGRILAGAQKECPRGKWQVAEL